MRSVLIADDEPLIVSGLSEHIDWASMDCRVAAAAANGEEALRYIEALNPDILLTDIVMPGLTGLELAERIRQQGRHTEVILLSTYDHFEYAREALRIGVCDYVLKPIEIDKLRDAVAKASRRLDEKSRSSLSGPSEQDAVFDAVLYGAEAGAAPLREARRGLIICVRTYNRAEESAYGIISGIREALKERLSREGAAVYTRASGGMLILTALLPDRLSVRDAETAVRDAMRAVPEGEALCVASVGATAVPPAGLHAQYRDCERDLSQGYFATASGILPHGVGGTAAAVQEEIDALMTALRSGQAEALESAFGALRTKLAGGRNPEQAAHTVRELFRLATNQASRMGMAEKPQVRKRYFDETFDESMDSMLAYLRTICLWAQRERDHGARLRQILEDHYRDPSFGLAEAAEILGMSMPYLSRVFKRETGEGFQETLTRLRLDEATRLLKTTDRRIRDIASAVGFENERYFSQVFRKHMGCTPGTFRDGQ